VDTLCSLIAALLGAHSAHSEWSGLETTLSSCMALMSAHPFPSRLMPQLLAISWKNLDWATSLWAHPCTELASAGDTSHQDLSRWWHSVWLSSTALLTCSWPQPSAWRFRCLTADSQATLTMVSDGPLLQINSRNSTPRATLNRPLSGSASESDLKSEPVNHSSFATLPVLPKRTDKPLLCI